MKNHYEARKIVWVSHDPIFFPDRNAHRFEVFDGDDGRRIGTCTVQKQSKNGVGWIALTDTTRSGPYPTRAGALRALVGEDPAEKTRSIESDMTAKIIFEREIVLIQPHPLKGTRLALNENRPSPELSPWTSVACAVVQTSPQGVQHAVVTADDPNALFQPVKESDALGLLPESRTTLSAEDFSVFVSAYTTSMNNLDNVRALAMLIEKYAPAMRFIPQHLVPSLRDGDRFLGRIFMRYDLSKFQALARFGPEEHQQPKKAHLEAIGFRDEDCEHIVSGWYAFHDIDRAIEMKIRAPADMGMVVHAVSREYVTA